MEREELTEGDLLLRCWAAQDVAAVVEACQDPLIQRWTTVPVPYLEEHARGFVDQAAAGWVAGLPQFAVTDRGDGRLLAAVGMAATTDAEVYEIGFWTAPSARGRGIATSALRRVGAFAFERMGAVRLEWRAEVGNLGSRRVAEKNGYVVEGVLRGRLRTRDGNRVDCWIGGLLREDLPSG